MNQTATALRLLVSSVIIGLALAFVAVMIRPDLIAPNGTGSTPQSGYAAAVAVSAPAVVNIFTELGSDIAPNESAVPLRNGLGSGVIISADGLLVTNWHVISGARQLIAQLSDGRIAVPAVVGSDPETELALLKIDLPDLPYIEFGHSDRLRVGDIVLAIGNSMGLSQTVTMGIISATGRGQLNVATFENFIQTDAAINIGSSGGALVNTSGRLVGINTAVVGASGWQRAAPEGIGFAIPINLVRGVLEQLQEHGRVIRGYMGVEPTDISLREAESLGLEAPAVLLQRVWGPAAQAGLAAGDIMTHINGQRITDRQQAITIVASSQPGQTLRIRVTRIGERRFETDVVLIERPAQTAANQ